MAVAEDRAKEVVELLSYMSDSFLNEVATEFVATDSNRAQTLEAFISYALMDKYITESKQGEFDFTDKGEHNAS